MATWGGQRIYTKGRKPKADFGTAVMLSVGEPLHPGPDDDAVEVTKVLKSRIETLVNDSIERYPLRPESGTWWWPADLGGGAPARPDDAGEQAVD
jgi:hypothetical protein